MINFVCDKIKKIYFLETRLIKASGQMSKTFFHFCSRCGFYLFIKLLSSKPHCLLINVYCFIFCLFFGKKPPFIQQFLIVAFDTLAQARFYSCIASSKLLRFTLLHCKFISLSSMASLIFWRISFLKYALSLLMIRFAMVEEQRLYLVEDNAEKCYLTLL